jgi:hypothetical protein
MVRLEGLGQLKKFNDLIENRTRDLPACSVVPQRTTLPRAPASSKYFNYIGLGPFYMDDVNME